MYPRKQDGGFSNGLSNNWIFCSMNSYKTSHNGLLSRLAYITIFCFGLLLILFKTLYPFDFIFTETYRNLSHSFLFLGWGTSHIEDVIGNGLLFLPFGFGLAGCLMQTIGLSRLNSLVVILVSFWLSYTIEVLQVFQPSRFPSFIDVISNSASGMLAFLCLRLWKCKVKVIHFTSSFVKNNLLVCFLGYAILAFLISIPLQWYTSLSNWDKTFHLLLGNEKTGDRPWQGYISELYIADRAISEAEVVQVFSKKDPVTLIGTFLLASYLPEQVHLPASVHARAGSQSGQLTGTVNYHDRMGHLSDLVWRGGFQDDQQGESVSLGLNHWLETAAPAEYLIQRIVKTSQFTLGISVATSNTNQTGPARIISLSKDTGHRNFTLGQRGSDLVFRLRTPITGRNGVNPELIVPNLFSTISPQNLVITYDGSNLHLYVNGIRNSHALKLNPGGIFLNYSFQLDTYHLVCYKIIYYAIIFIPLGILLSITVNAIKVRIVVKMLTICGGILLSSFIIEVILMSMHGRDLRLGNLLISMIFTAGPIVLLNYCYGNLID